jgi:DNA polymerase
MLDAIRADIGPDCSRCKLHTLGRRQIVFGVGNPDADLMFVGKRPVPTRTFKAYPLSAAPGSFSPR